jgi:hypothetical protein
MPDPHECRFNILEAARRSQDVFPHLSGLPTGFLCPTSAVDQAFVCTLASAFMRNFATLPYRPRRLAPKVHPLLHRQTLDRPQRQVIPPRSSIDQRVKAHDTEATTLIIEL